MVDRIDSHSDIIDVRDIIARYEDLGAIDRANPSDEDVSEYVALRELLAELRGNGGDEQWRGDWYPVTLVRDSYFVEYSRELIEDCGYIAKDFPTWIEIDWQATARNVRMDYTCVEFEGVTFWYR